MNAVVAVPAPAQFTWARGYGERDNTPELRAGETFDDLAMAIGGDRATGKRQQWISGAFAVAQDDAAHRLQKSTARAIGKPHRCKACALPRRWIGLDVDGGLTAESFAHLVALAGQWQGIVYTTASHTAAEPRCRVILAVDVACDRTLLIRATEGLRALIDRGMVNEGHAAPQWDTNCDRPEQPLYLPVVTSSLYPLEGRPAVIAELLAYATPAHAVAPATAAQSRTDGNASITEGGRNSALTSMAGSMRRRGFDHGVIESALQAHNATHCAPPLPDSEVRTIARSISRYEPALGSRTEGKTESGKDGQAKTWRLTRVGDLLKEPAPARWMVRGILEQNTLACVFGAPGSCKTFLVLDIAGCVATGSAWHGHKVAQGAVVYLAGEGHHGLLRRFLAWTIEHGNGTDAPLFLSSAAIDLAGETPAIADAVAACCENPALIVIDTLHRHLRLGADENSSTDMGALIASADALRARFGCAVILVHHTGHGASDRERGSSALRGSLDWSYSVQKGNDGPLIFQCRKSKDYELPEPMKFALHRIELPWRDEDGEPEASAVLRPTGKGDAAFGGNQLLAMMKLKELAYAAKGSPVQISDWRMASGVDRRRWPEVMTSLSERGAILVEDDAVRLPDLDG